MAPVPASAPAPASAPYVSLGGLIAVPRTPDCAVAHVGRGRWRRGSGRIRNRVAGAEIATNHAEVQLLEAKISENVALMLQLDTQHAANHAADDADADDYRPARYRSARGAPPTTI